MNSFTHRIISMYRLAAKFMLAAFIVALIPIVAEAVQHIVEVKFGMFAPDDGLDERENKIRLFVGLFKVLSIALIGFILPRYYIHNQQLRRAFRFSAKARRVLLIMGVVLVAYVCLALLGGPVAIEFLENRGVVLPAKLKPFLPVIVLAIIMIPLQYKTIGSIATVFDDAPMSKMETSKLNKLMNGGAILSLLFAIAPVMVLHYFLNSYAMGKMGFTLFLVLAIDSIAVGVLAVLLAASVYVVYKESREAD